MADYDTDAARERRRERLLVVKPTAADDAMQEREFRATYHSYRVVERDRIAAAEQAKHVMFCPACEKPHSPRMIKARVLHVSYEEDPLRNYPALARLECQGCGWGESIPIIPPEVGSAEQDLATRFRAMTGGLISSGALGKAQDMFLTTSKFDLNPIRSLPGTQLIADKAWAACEGPEATLRDAAMAAAQIEALEKFERDQSMRKIAKVAQLSSGYGGSLIAQQYSSQLGNMIAKQVDDEVYRQMMKQELARLDLPSEQLMQDCKAAPKKAIDVLRSALRKVAK